MWFVMSGVGKGEWCLERMLRVFGVGVESVERVVEDMIETASAIEKTLTGG